MLHFYKYQATGNDFVLIDNREQKRQFTMEEIGKICDRKFGIGADGLILLEKDAAADFKMIYYNGDGSQSLCGNGCRTAIDLASKLGMVNGKARFSAYDGMHEATLLGNGTIRVKMNDVQTWKKLGEDYFINTGSPHVIRFVQSAMDVAVVEEGRKIRNSPSFAPGGTNVNFAEVVDDHTVFVRTYERGVEDETLSCGTGVTAVALAAALKGFASPVQIRALGGSLSVEFKMSQADGQVGIFTDIFLTGPAKLVFEGDLDL